MANLNQSEMVIKESPGDELYDAAIVYLGSKISPHIFRTNVKKLRSQKSVSVTVEPDQEMIDSFQGLEFKWKIHDSTSSNTRFKLCFDKKHEEFVRDSYLPFVLEEAEKKKEATKIPKIFTVDEVKKIGWMSNNLDHPATLATFPMDVRVKKVLREDLDKFLESREECLKMGMAWRRRYLICGPPMTGKTSLVASIANFLNFDLYELELRNLKSKWVLKNLLKGMKSRSILVVENVDSTMMPPTNTDGGESESQEANKITLLDFMKLMDGLWASSGNERIVIYTTRDLHLKYAIANFYAEGIDYRFELSYCKSSCFRFLADNYFGIQDHQLFEEIEELLPTSSLTPSEDLRPKSEDLLPKAFMTPGQVADYFFKSDKTDPDDFFFDFLFELKWKVARDQITDDKELSYWPEKKFRTEVKVRFKLLAHPLFREIGELIRTAKVSSVQIGEQLRKFYERDELLDGLVQFLKKKTEKKKYVKGHGQGNEDDAKMQGIQNENEKDVEMKGIEDENEDDLEMKEIQNENEDIFVRQSVAEDASTADLSCTPAYFRLLASSLLKLEEHRLFREIEELLLSTEVTANEIEEEFRQGEADEVLATLITFLQLKRERAAAKQQFKARDEIKQKKISNRGGRGGRTNRR